MQLTKFDRWLKEKFVYQTYIHTLRRPENPGPGIREVPVEKKAGQRFNHLFLAADSKSADRFIEMLKAENQMYHTQIEDRKAWYVRFIAPEHKSVTWFIFSSLCIAAALATAARYVMSLWENPQFRANFSEALDLLKK